MLIETLKLALQAIARNAMRSSLTVLGVVIGVAAVIAMVTIGGGATAKVTEEIGKLGTNILFVVPGKQGPGRAGSPARPFTVKDAAAMASQVPRLRAVAPISQTMLTVVYGGSSRMSSVAGTVAAYLPAAEWKIVAGRSFTEAEERGSAACIIGETVRAKLFGSILPVGETIRVGKIACEVIGVLGKKGQSGMGADQDDLVLMPLRTYQRRIAGNSDVGVVMVSAERADQTKRVQADIERLMRERRGVMPGKEDDFSVFDMAQVTEAMSGTTTILTGLLAAVAAVSLLVGGIGIMNIMLVSVTERTREIGIRLAIGAFEGQVLMQFLVEATVLALFGGMLGIVLGLALALGVNSFLGLPFVFNPTIIGVAFVFSALTGMGFGYFPARQAARLNPIEALRHE